MKPLTIKFQPIGAARDYAELQAILREVADGSGKSRDEIDGRAGLPDRFSSKALAPVPVGTCQLGAKTLGKMLRELGLVLIVATTTRGLDRAADSAVKRREEQVRVKLLSTEVWNAAKTRLARENGRKGGKARMEKTTPAQRQRIARKGGRCRWRKPKVTEVPAARAPDTSAAVGPTSRAPPRHRPRSAGTGATTGRAPQSSPCPMA